MTPTELVEHAAKSGLSAIAVSDHDCTDGIDEALEAGKRFGIEIIPALELSVQALPKLTYSATISITKTNFSWTSLKK